MSAIFNHATRYYDLKDNPCQKVGNMGKKKAKEMLFWTRDEFFQFIETMKSKPMSYYAFELLFWTGIREGELLVLTREDVDLEKKILHIRKSYQRLERKDVITEPKTEKSNRDINLPDFLCEELEDYFGMLYKSTFNVLQILLKIERLTSSSRRSFVIVFGAISAFFRKSDLLISLSTNNFHNFLYDTAILISPTRYRTLCLCKMLIILLFQFVIFLQCISIRHSCDIIGYCPY